MITGSSESLRYFRPWLIWMNIPSVSTWEWMVLVRPVDWMSPRYSISLFFADVSFATMTFDGSAVRKGLAVFEGAADRAAYAGVTEEEDAADCRSCTMSAVETKSLPLNADRSRPETSSNRNASSEKIVSPCQVAGAGFGRKAVVGAVVMWAAIAGAGVMGTPVAGAGVVELDVAWAAAVFCVGGVTGMAARASSAAVKILATISFTS